MRPATSTSCRSLASVAALCIAMFFPAASYGLDPVDELLDRSEQEGNGEELVELLHELRNRPVPVNTATERELLRLPLLSAGEASKIVEWRNSKGLFASPEELSLVIGPGSADRISPYLSFDLPRATPGKSR
ncbi:MAG: helix-hairpin-helix domain-containing protein, partial [Chlorobiaceae bacterium]|nr:helix-hairpin-helix domain-containing protein [Chlorobiaceae bacterium]